MRWNATAGQGPDRVLIARTWRRIALYTAALFAIGVVGLDALTLGVVLDNSRSGAARQLTRAMDDPDALTSPPLDIDVYVWDGEHLRSSQGAAREPADSSALADPPAVDQIVRRGGREYLVRTYRAGTITVQLALDLSLRDRERDRLYVGLAVIGCVGMLMAGGLGAVIARRAIAPLGHALLRQQRFVADASHELRTPLTQLHTRAQLMAHELGTTDDLGRLEDDVAHMVRGTRQMGEIVGELLIAAQLREQPQSFGAVDVLALANEAVAAELPRASRSGVNIVVRAAEADRYLVRGAESALRRVFGSLVDNALGHTAAGGTISVELAADDGRTIAIRIRDTGCGFDPSRTPRLFERFYRGENGDGRRFGLGLSLVRDVVGSHDGTVSADATPGLGACFTVRLPRWRDPAGRGRRAVQPTGP
jgi:two-component system OmpR family sensor kinase